MKKVKTLFWLILLGFLSGPSYLLAQQIEEEPGGDGRLESPITAESIPDILNNIVDWLLVIAAPIAIIMTIWAGFLFMTGGGNEEKVKKARQTLLYVVIGVAILILSKGLISLVKSFL